MGVPCEPVILGGEVRGKVQRNWGWQPMLEGARHAHCHHMW